MIAIGCGMKKLIHNPLNFNIWSIMAEGDDDGGGEPQTPPSPHPTYEPEPPVHTDILALAW